MTDTESRPITTDEEGYFQGYVTFARILRTWLIAYGVGVPALCFTQDRLAARFLVSDRALVVIGFFLLGTLSQLVVALLYKGTMWYLYLGERSTTLKARRVYKIADAISEAYWLELLFDLATIIFFSTATYQLLRIFIRA